MKLVLDCCSLVHAKAMGGLKYAPLELLTAMGQAGTLFISTPTVRGELEASSLRATLGSWSSAGWLSLSSPTMQQRRETRNYARKRDPLPGDADLGLVTLARCMEMPLLTHDGPASTLASRCGVDVLDLADIAAVVAHLGLLDLAEIDSAWGNLEGFPWPWPNYPWGGSLVRTLAMRPKLEDLLARLLETDAKRP